MERLIFVQIASYRDYQLAPTLWDMIKMADTPENLRFCIAWQHDSTESLTDFIGDERFNVLDIPHTESRGVCWARNQIQANYNGEAYTLAIDSHHRFVAGWDTLCIKLIEDLQANGHAKPLLTTYAPPFDPQNDPGSRDRNVTGMAFDRFTPEGAVFFKPSYLSKSLKSPVPARFFSGHFAFTLGSFCVEVPHDPTYYFHGEEINLAVRAFTHGYDLFHPHQIICWHEYTRRGRVKQWDDDETWHHRNTRSHQRNRRLFGMEAGEEDFGKYCFGSQRTLRDYEKYAGLNFQRRAVQLSTITNQPPLPQDTFSDDVNWEHSFSFPFSHIINLRGELFEVCDDWQFWCVIYQDRMDQELYRHDLAGENLSKVLEQLTLTGVTATESHFPIFHGREPKKWIIWPCSLSSGWRKKIEGTI